MYLKNWIVGAVFVFSPIQTMAQERPDALAGRFVGTAKMPDGLLQIVTADFIPLERGSSRNRYFGLIKFIFGNSSSHEYLVYRFPEIRRDQTSGDITIDPFEQDLNLTHAALDGINGHLDMTGRVNDAPEGTVIFKLSRNGDYHDEGFVRPKLEGIYQSTCGNKEHPDLLSLITSRFYTDAPLGTNPFAVYQIVGAQGRWMSDVQGIRRYQTMYPISSGVYDFFTGELQLQGSQYFACKRNHEGIICDKCLYRPRSGPPSHTVDVEWGSFSQQEFDPSSQIQFETFADDQKDTPYKGYIRHALSGVHQKIELHVNATPATTSDNNTIKISAQVALEFERKELEPARLTFRFEPRVLVAPKISGVTLFNIPKGYTPADPILHITHFSKNEIRGTWYSWIFGRVGDFSVKKAEQASLPQGTKRMWALDGTYDAGFFPAYWARYMTAIQTIPGRYMSRTENPYFPMTFGGYMMVNSQMTPGLHQRFTDGSFDYFTGRFNIGNYFVGDVELGTSPPRIHKVDIVKTGTSGFIPAFDPSSHWSWAMPFRVCRKPSDYWSHTDGLESETETMNVLQ